MKHLILLASAFGALNSYALIPGRKPAEQGIATITWVDSAKYKIAVLDTGFDPSRAQQNVRVCKSGHYDFMYEKENLNFMNPHGTRIADLLAEKLRGVDYCLIFIQMFRNVEPMYPIPDDYVEALTRVREAGATAVNISLKSFEFVSQDQKNAFAETTKKIPIFLAAGNEYRDLSKKCDIYPVCYPFKHLIVVGAQDFENPKKHASYSNYGARVNLWAPGHFIDSDQEPLFGTSYATPRALAEYILFLESKSKKSCDAKTHKCVGH